MSKQDECGNPRSRYGIVEDAYVKFEAATMKISSAVKFVKKMGSIPEYQDVIDKIVTIDRLVDDLNSEIYDIWMKEQQR